MFFKSFCNQKFFLFGAQNPLMRMRNFVPCARVFALLPPVTRVSRGRGGGSLFPSKIALCSHVPTHFPNVFVLSFFEFCSPVPKNWLMFPCSLRYFANVPLFPKTPGRPSVTLITQAYRVEYRRAAGSRTRILVKEKKLKVRKSNFISFTCI